MKKIELFLCILFALSIAMGLFMLPENATVTIISLPLLSMLYFYFGFAIFNDIELRNIVKKESYKGIGALRIVGAVGTGFSLSILLIGIMFSLLSWPGHRQMILVGIISLPIILIIALAKFFTNYSKYYVQIFKRVIVFGVLGLLLFLFPNQWIEMKYRNYPAYLEAFKANEADPYNEDLRVKMEDERNKMYELRNE